MEGHNNLVVEEDFNNKTLTLEISVDLEVVSEDLNKVVVEDKPEEDSVIMISHLKELKIYLDNFSMIVRCSQINFK